MLRYPSNFEFHNLPLSRNLTHSFQYNVTAQKFIPSLFGGTYPSPFPLKLDIHQQRLKEQRENKKKIQQTKIHKLRSFYLICTQRTFIKVAKKFTNIEKYIKTFKRWTCSKRNDLEHTNGHWIYEQIDS